MIQSRIKSIRKLICDSLSIDEDQIVSIYAQEGLSDIYEIRYQALGRLLTKEEWIRLLIHLSQRRGFLSNRKADDIRKMNDYPKDDSDRKEDDEQNNKEKNEGELLKAVSANRELMKEKGYRTIGEMLYLDDKFSKGRRNKSGDYSCTISRDHYLEEVATIFEQQRKLGSKFAPKELEDKYVDILSSQRSFDEGPGPGKDSKYSGNQIEKMLKSCTLERGETRAPKASFTFECFNLLSKINAVKIISRNTRRALTDEERRIIKELAYNQKDISYSTLRKILKLNDDEMFNISYILTDEKKGKKKSSGAKPFELRDSVEKRTKFNYIRAYHTFKKAYGDAYDSWCINKRNDLAYVLTVFKTDKKIIEKLAEKNFTEDEISIALKIPSFSGFGNLSDKAMGNIIPYLEDGLLYNDAAERAGYNFKADDKCASMYLPARASIPPEHRISPDQICAPELDDITNPVVSRAVSQTIKVVNAIIREMGCSPTYINIELAREMGKSYAERGRLDALNKKNHERNEKLMDELRKEFKLSNPTGQDLLKLKLWQDQQGRCMYSGMPIERARLFEDGYAEIDHIIPYSISFDNRYKNKVLVHARENQKKGNRLPLEYLNGKDADDFRIRVEASTLRYDKKRNLLKEEFTEEERKDWKLRNIVDTQYISKFMSNFIKKYLKFEGQARVTCVNGGVTDFLRKRWRIQKIRANGDTHHSLDAGVIACVTQKLIKKVTLYSIYEENKCNSRKKEEMNKYITENELILELYPKTGELTNNFILPYPTFREELVMLTSNDPARILSEHPLPNYDGSEELKPIFVSRMPKRTTHRKANESTIRGYYEFEGKEYSIQKVPLEKLTLDNKTGKIVGKKCEYYNPDSDRLLYDALKARLTDFGGNGEKAFAEPFRKPKSDGSDGPIVKSVKMIKRITSYVTLSKDSNEIKEIAENGDRVRTDVFYVEGEGYYLVPIYAPDTIKKKLPNRAIVQGKSMAEWILMDDKDFIFSLYPNDLVRIVFRNDKNFKIKKRLKKAGSTLPDEVAYKEGYFYFQGVNISTGSITIENNDSTYYSEPGPRNLVSFEKYEVDVLGNIHKVNKEKRMGF